MTMRVALSALALLLGAGAFAYAPSAHAQKEMKNKSPVVAVFPFKVLNPGPQFAHFGEGAAEAIVNKIVKDKALRIVEESQLDKAINNLARNQTGLFEEDSALAIGRMVDAKFIVIGSVDVMADQIAVSARVLEVETRQLLVSERVFGAMAGAFQLYDELAAKMITAMTYHLSQRVSHGESADQLAVRQLIDEGKRYDPQFGGSDLKRALASYNKAVLRDPKNAVARLAFGDASFRLAQGEAATDPGKSREHMATAREQLRRATELDDKNAFAWTVLGRIEGRMDNHAGARRSFERALSADASYVPARYLLAFALYRSGELQGARAEAEEARKAGSTEADALIRQIDQAVAMKKQKPDATATR